MEIIHNGEFITLDKNLIAESLRRAEARTKKPKRLMKLDGGELDSQLTRCEKMLRWEVYEISGNPYRFVPADSWQPVRATSAYFQRRLAAFFIFEKKSRYGYVRTDCSPKLAAMLARAGNFPSITKLEHVYSGEDES